MATVLFASLRDYPIRYLIYTAPAAIAIDICIRQGNKVVFYKQRLYEIALVIVMMAWPVVNYVDNGINTAIFIVLPYAALVFSVRTRLRYMYMLFWLLVLSQLCLSIASGVSLLSIFKTNLLEHVNNTETHTIPFVLGLLIGPVLIEKRYFMFFAGLIAVLLGEKRIVIIAIVIGVSAATLFHKFSISEKLRANIFMLIGVFCMVFNAIMPLLFEIISEKFGLNVNVFTSGRFAGQSVAYSNIYKRNVFEQLFGSGLGRADLWASQGWGVPGLQIHNDYLRMICDMGIIPAIIIIILIVRWIGGGKFGSYLFSYVVIIWFTDNTLTYAFYNMTLAMLVLSVESDYNI